MSLKLKYRKEQYPFVTPNIDDWPIVHLMNDKEAFKKSVVEFSKNRILELHENRLDEEIAKTMFLERERIENDPWRVDPPNEKKFWSKVQKNLLKQPLDDSSIYRILRRASDILGLADNHHFSGNSIRVGAAQELSKQGLKVREIQDFGRWLSPAMPAQYVGYTGTAESEKMKFKAIVPWQ